jgi:DNA-binding IclR family transcriptional regulator
MNKKNRKIPRESERHVEAVAKALSILECFTGSEPELSLKQLTEKTGLNKSRILRLCGTLADQGFLVRMARSSYRLGPKLMMLGKIYERTNTLASVARPILRELASLTGESASLFVIEGAKRLCVAREEGPSPIRYIIREGDLLELYVGAGGKALLAYAYEEFRRQVLNGRVLERFTSSTIVEWDRLEEELEIIRGQGYAVSKGERTPEAAAVAVPVFDHESKVCAALTIAGPVQRFSTEHCQEMLKSLQASARKLSLLLGNREHA